MEYPDEYLDDDDYDDERLFEYQDPPNNYDGNQDNDCKYDVDDTDENDEYEDDYEDIDDRLFNDEDPHKNDEENQEDDGKYDTDDTDKEDEDEEQVDLLYRCGCKWKGAEPCSAAFDNKEAMWQHLINIHHTSKWIVKVYSRIH